MSLVVHMVVPPHLSLAESCNNVFTTSCCRLVLRIRFEESSEPTGSQWSVSDGAVTLATHSSPFVWDCLRSAARMQHDTANRHSSESKCSVPRRNFEEELIFSTVQFATFRYFSGLLQCHFPSSLFPPLLLVLLYRFTFILLAPLPPAPYSPPFLRLFAVF